MSESTHAEAREVAAAGVRRGALRRASWFLVAALACGMHATLGAQETLYTSNAYRVTATGVQQGQFAAEARGRDTIVSNYPRAAREVHFKFALNGVDNEFPPGIEHTINLRPHGGRQVTPLYVFAVPPQPVVPRPDDAREGEDGTALVTIRLDMRAVKRSIAETGGYTPPLGARVTRLESVWVIGDTDPLLWDVRKYSYGMPQELKDPEGDGIYEVTLPFATDYLRPRTADGRAVWARSGRIDGAPELLSPQPLLDALYRLSLEELAQLKRTDGALSAGAKWPGVWTRDVALSTVLALAFVAPDAARTSLLMKVDSAGRIIQDTGTGGSWPISTDRMTWALAAWEIYAMTGDRAWLRQAYTIIARSAQADRHAAFDASTGLFRGETSFLDWREQSYPRWMQPADIYQSQALGTNAVHHGAYRVLAAMARALGESPRRWDAMADSVRTGMNAHLWQDALGVHAPFRYGRLAMNRSPGTESLGEALALVYGATLPAQRERVMQSAPLVAFGTPTFWPFIAGVPFYHNATIWPFVTAYWTWAAADARSTQAVEQGLASLARGAALFLTNKENMVASTGHFEGTALNSDRQLWSVAGTLAMTYRVLFGMRAEEAKLSFRPMVPPSYAGERVLRHVKYRGADLTIIVRGTGAGVARARLDGRVMARAEVPATLAGAHELVLDLDGTWPSSTVRVVAAHVAPETPVATMQLLGADSVLTWGKVPHATRYVVYHDARAVDTTVMTTARVVKSGVLGEYQVAALDSAGVSSFRSEPVRVIAPLGEQRVRANGPGTPAAQNALHATRPDARRLERADTGAVRFSFTVARAGRYALDARYANGSGPINTEDKAAVRTLRVDGREAGVLVMPQRGSGRWDDWGYTNPLVVKLAAGRHEVTVRWTALDENMNRHVSTALVDHLRVTALPETQAPAGDERVTRRGRRGR